MLVQACEASRSSDAVALVQKSGRGRISPFAAGLRRSSGTPERIPVRREGRIGRLAIEAIAPLWRLSRWLGLFIRSARTRVAGVRGWRGELSFDHPSVRSVGEGRFDMAHTGARNGTRRCRLILSWIHISSCSGCQSRSDGPGCPFSGSGSGRTGGFSRSGRI
jgi:hypothetical protein